MSEIDNLNWRCFLALEEEFISTQYFVEIHKNNYNTFSIKYRSIIMQACAEIEIILKRICAMNSNDRVEVKKYFDFLEKNHSDFLNIEVSIPIYKELIKPWLGFTKDSPPEFWTANNKIKHAGRFEESTLENVINALSGLFSVLLFWYVKSHGSEFSKNTEIIPPKLFDFPGLKENLMAYQNSNYVIVPGLNKANVK